MTLPVSEITQRDGCESFVLRDPSGVRLEMHATDREHIEIDGCKFGRSAALLIIVSLSCWLQTGSMIPGDDEIEKAYLEPSEN